MSGVTVQVLDTGQVMRWTNLLERLPEACRDVYFTPGYARLYEGPGRRARCVVVEHHDELLLHVFIERRLESELTRRLGRPVVVAESLYGYGGPLASTDDPAFLTVVHATLSAWQREEGLVSEFVRFHPILRNERVGLPEWRVTLDRHTVAMRLDSPAEAGWRAEYGSVQRNRLRRARQAGVVVEAARDPEDWRAFIQLYLETMTRVGAPAFYLFGADYFSALQANLPDNSLLFVARWGGRVAAGAVILPYGKVLHHHLSGSARDAQAVAPNNLLFDEVARWGAERGYSWLHLGGGRSPAPHDDLLRFKARFARPRCPFFIGRGVYDEATHRALREAWIGSDPRRVSLAERYFQVYALDEEPEPA
jgi:hypothetical protein